MDIRQVDKTGMIHIGYKNDYNQKILTYYGKTRACAQLQSNPVMDIYYKVVQALIWLKSQKSDSIIATEDDDTWSK